jgi:hypothetical protein
MEADSAEVRAIPPISQRKMIGPNSIIHVTPSLFVTNRVIT